MKKKEKNIYTFNFISETIFDIFMNIIAILVVGIGICSIISLLYITFKL